MSLTVRPGWLITRAVPLFFTFELDVIPHVFGSPVAESWSRIGMRDCPVSVSEYSTFGGTCGTTLRITSPSFSSSRSFFRQHPLGDPGLEPLLTIWLKRSVPSRTGRRMTSGFHFPPITSEGRLDWPVTVFVFFRRGSHGINPVSREHICLYAL